ncbi:MAG TPA: MFS transporter [Pyrinomonadaceae bacterium]|nr:MFS transporter [Pyrinomonadaceae bacterium]
MPNVIKDPCDEAVMLSRKSLERCSKKQARWILAATILASSMAFIDGTVVNVALPSLQQSLHATAVGVQWVVEAYALFLSALLLVGGSLGDQFGRRRVFVIGVLIFALASAWCGIAPNISQLIVARAVQGVGAALLVPGSLAIISASFPEETRGKAIGTWSGFSAITTAIGPVLGGWLVEHVSWRAVFYLNLPIAAAIVFITFFRVPESRDREKRGRIDVAGAALATFGLGSTVYGLIESSAAGFAAWHVWLALVCGLLAIVLFVIWEDHAKSPMLPLKLFRSRNFTGTNILTLLLYFALGGALFFFTLNLIQVQGFSPTAAGAALLPFVLLMFALSRWSGGLIARFGPRLPLLIGPTIAAIGFALFSLPAAGAHYWSGFFPGVVVLGIGMAISVAPLTTTVMSSVPQAQAGVASGINNAVSRAAGLLAVAVLGVVMLQVFSNKLAQHLDETKLSDTARAAVYEQRIKLGGLELPNFLSSEEKRQVDFAVKQSFVSAFRISMIIAALTALSSSISTWFFVKNTPKK